MVKKILGIAHFESKEMQLHSNDCWRSSTGGSEQHKKEQTPEKGSSMWRKENEYMSHPGMQSGEGKKQNKKRKYKAVCLVVHQLQI